MGTNRIPKAIWLFGMVVLAFVILWGSSSFGEQQKELDELSSAVDAGPNTSAGKAKSVNEQGSNLAENTSLGRNPIEQQFTLALADEEGAAVDGEIWLLARTPSLEERLSTGRYAGTYLFEDSLLAQDQTVHGKVEFSIQGEWTKNPLFAFVAAPGFAPQAVIAKPGPHVQSVKLHRIDPITVFVKDSDGKAVVNAACWLTPMFTNWVDGPDDWFARLALRGYMEESFTDVEGRATFLTCYSDSGNSIKVYPEPPLAVAAASFCEAGQEVHMTCAFGFAVAGSIFDEETGEPIAGAFAIMTEELPEGSRTVTSQLTNVDGSYRQEALPAGTAVFSIHAKAEGYAMQRERIYAPQPSSSHKLDFSLQPAEGLELQLLTTWGDPILDSLVQLRLGRNNLETDFQSTDENGIAHFPAELQKNTPYECLILVGSNFWALPDLSLQTGKEEVIVPGLSQVNMVVMPKDLPDGFTPTSLEWTSLANENQGMVVWERNRPSPLLPAGAGCLAVMSSDGRRLEMLATLEEGVNEQITFLSHPARLTFEWTGEEGAVLSLRSNMAWDWFKLEEPIAPGRVELELWQGTFSLMVESESGVLSFPALRLESGLTDLGPLGWVDSSGVQGRVHDANHDPLAGVEVNLFSMDVGPGGFATTDVQGNFAISGMSPGAYSLQVTGGKAYGGSVHEVQQEIFLAPAEAIQELDIQLEINEARYLEGRVVQSPPANSFAFSAAGGQAHMTDVLPSGSFLLPRPTASRWIGVGLQERGRVLFTMKQVEAGLESVLLDAPNILHLINIVDEHGAPWIDARIHAYVSGASLGYYSLPDSEGNLLLEVSSQAKANLQFRLPDGRVVVHSLSDLVTRETLTIPRNASFVQLELVDDQGNPIQGAAAMHYGVGDVFYGNGKGQLELPSATAKKPYLIMASGHLSIWDDALHSQQLTLPTLYPDIQLVLPGSLVNAESKPIAAWVRVRSLSLPAHAHLPGPFELSLDGSSVELPPLPAGEIEVQVFDAKGNVFSVKTLDVSSSAVLLKY